MGYRGKGANPEIATFRVKAPEGGEECKICVNVKEDVHGTILMSSVQMLVEEAVVEDEEMPPADTGAEGGDKKTSVIWHGR